MLRTMWAYLRGPILGGGGAYRRRNAVYSFLDADICTKLAKDLERDIERFLNQGISYGVQQQPIEFERDRTE